jgi:hypothetical protein
MHWCIMKPGLFFTCNTAPSWSCSGCCQPAMQPSHMQKPDSFRRHLWLLVIGPNTWKPFICPDEYEVQDLLNVSMIYDISSNTLFHYYTCCPPGQNSSMLEQECTDKVCSNADGKGGNDCWADGLNEPMVWRGFLCILLLVKKDMLKWAKETLRMSAKGLWCKQAMDRHVKKQTLVNGKTDLLMKLMMMTSNQLLLWWQWRRRWWR